MIAAALAVGCTTNAKVDEADGSSSPTSPAASAANDGVKFGTIASPCGKGKDGKAATIAAGEAGAGSDKLYLGVANERTSTVRNGLLREFWDTATAFAGWCNEQGGIQGLPVELVDLDAQVFQVEAAMTKACSSAFAMVGGGFVLDQQVFTGKPGSDFHLCKMVDITGFAVSTDFTEASGVLAAVPNPAYSKSATWLRDIAKLHPDKVGKTVVVWGELESMKVNKEQNKLTGQTVEGFGFLDPITYPAQGPDLTITTQQIMSSGATAVNFVGEPENLSQLMKFLKEAGYTGIVFADANQYDPLVFSSGDSSADGLLIRSAIHPFEERAQWPATDQYLDIMKKYGGSDPKIAALGIQSFSSFLLFAAGAKACAEGAGAGVLSRACVLDEAAKIAPWDGGGLHAAADPGNRKQSPCSLLMEARGGKFERIYPKAGSAEDQGGFSCYDDAIVTLSGDLGAGRTDPSYKR